MDDHGNAPERRLGSHGRYEPPPPAAAA
jgi:hypothetical protein